MQIALIKTKSEANNTTPKEIICKEDLYNKTTELVPVFAARWRSMRNISTAQMTN
jgi:hypothetical protein